MDNHLEVVNIDMNKSLIHICANMSAMLMVGLMMYGMCACSESYEPIAIHRLDRQISKGFMPKDSLSIKATELLFEISGYPDATDLTVVDYSEKPSIREHVESVEREYDEMHDESVALAGVFARLESLLPETRVPEVFTIISPFSQSIIVADTTLFIGLNHYLGADYRYYGYFPDYVRVLKERARIPVDVAEAIIRTTYPFNPTGDSQSAADRLAYEGAVAEAIMRVTGEDESYVLGYDDEQYRWLCENERNLWQTIVGRQLLFSTDYAVIRSLVDVAPQTTVISSAVPGRAGRFIGHRIVKAYLQNNPESDVSSLLRESLYSSPNMLMSAKYNP